MNHKTILEQMGIQQWRLRQSIELNADIVIEPSPQVVTAKDDIAAEIIHEQVSAAVNLMPDKPKEFDWSGLMKVLNDQQTCPSCAQSKPILGDGNPSADWMFVFDSPSSRDIDQQQLLTGRAGQLFDAILLALSLDRQKVYLSSVFKCPPAEDLSTAMPQCADLLKHQILLVKPKVVIALGEFVSQALIKANDGLDQLRQKPQKHFDQAIAIVPTYTLMQMLESPALKADVWNDLKAALRIVANQ